MGTLLRRNDTVVDARFEADECGSSTGEAEMVSLSGKCRKVMFAGIDPFAVVTE